MSTAREWVDEYAGDHDEPILLIDEFDDALLGLVHRGHEVFACYSMRGCLDILIKDGMTEEEAMEHFDYNVLGAILEGIPCFLVRPDDDL